MLRRLPAAPEAAPSRVRRINLIIATSTPSLQALPGSSPEALIIASAMLLSSKSQETIGRASEIGVKGFWNIVSPAVGMLFRVGNAISLNVDSILGGGP
jgi:hypothetical protein